VVIRKNCLFVPDDRKIPATILQSKFSGCRSITADLEAPMHPQFLSSPVTIVTNCTSRKKFLGGSVLAPTPSRDGDINATATNWIASASTASPRCPAAELYQGRSFQDALSASSLAGAQLGVVSAGFGLVPATAALPHYNLTVSDGSGSIKHWLSVHGHTSADWWTALTHGWQQGTPLAHLVASPDACVILLALPSTYLAMIRNELAAVSKDGASRLRIFTSSTGARLLPEQLLPATMPYDERLESIAGFAGTKADFPQRALRHFIEVLQGHRVSSRVGARLVDQALGTQPQPTRPVRTKASDDEIAELLKAQWASLGGSSTKLLRYLRDTANVACEQGRFRTLWLSMKAIEG
jgi:hypothetical protein